MAMPNSIQMLKTVGVTGWVKERFTKAGNYVILIPHLTRATGVCQ
jgi:hypothetical protein